MEYFIFNCYKKWLEGENGNIFKQFSKRNLAIKSLIISLLVSLIAIVVIFVLCAIKVLDEWWIFVPTVAEVIISIVAYIYTSRYEINNSSNDLKGHREYCDRLNNMLEENGVANSFIIKIIERYKITIEEMNKKMELNYERINKVMQILIVPLSVAILGSVVRSQLDTQWVLGYGISFFILISFFYGLSVFVAFLYNDFLADKQNKYKQFVNDLQSIIDFQECEKNLEKDDTVTSSSEEDTAENVKSHSQSII